MLLPGVASHGNGNHGALIQTFRRCSSISYGNSNNDPHCAWRLNQLLKTRKASGVNALRGPLSSAKRGPNEMWFRS